MSYKKMLSAFTAVLMSAACMLPYSAIAAENDTAVSVSAESQSAQDENSGYEKLEFKDNTVNRITEDIDGYIYDLFVRTEEPHESPKLPSLTQKGNGAFSADLFYDEYVSASAGKRFDNVPSGDHNYCIRFEYTNEPTVSKHAKVILHDPDITLYFYDISETESQKRFSKYAGTLELNGEEYIVEHDSYHSGGDFRFYHVRSDESMSGDKITSTFPLYALIHAAKEFGLETGSIYEISAEISGYDTAETVTILKNEIYEDEVSLLDKEEPYKVGADISQRIQSDIVFDNFDYYCPEYFLLDGSRMNAFSKGRFSGEYKKPKYPLSKTYCEFSTLYNFENLTVPDVGKAQDIRIDYSVNDDLTGKYGIYFDAMLQSPTSAGSVRKSFAVAEKIAGADTEEFFNSFEEELGNNHLDLKSTDFIRTYTAGGHEYDLYKGCYRFYGCFNSYDEIRYIAFRKDSSDDEKLESSISLCEHLSQLDELSGQDIPVYNLLMGIRTLDAEGKFDVTKQDISVIDRTAAPEIVRGDFNGDMHIDSMDVARARTELLKSMSKENEDIPVYADINLNGKFDVADIVMLQSFVLGKIKAFPTAEAE